MYHENENIFNSIAPLWWLCRNGYNYLVIEGLSPSKLNSKLFSFFFLINVVFFVLMLSSFLPFKNIKTSLEFLKRIYIFASQTILSLLLGAEKLSMKIILI